MDRKLSKLKTNRDAASHPVFCCPKIHIIGGENETQE